MSCFFFFFLLVKNMTNEPYIFFNLHDPGTGTTDYVDDYWTDVRKAFDLMLRRLFILVLHTLGCATCSITSA